MGAIYKDEIRPSARACEALGSLDGAHLPEVAAILEGPGSCSERIQGSGGRLLVGWAWGNGLHPARSMWCTVEKRKRD